MSVDVVYTIYYIILYVDNASKSRNRRRGWWRGCFFLLHEIVYCPILFSMKYGCSFDKLVWSKIFSDYKVWLLRFHINRSRSVLIHFNVIGLCEKVFEIYWKWANFG